MNGETFQVGAWIVIFFAGLRSCLRIRLEGWSKPVLILLITILSWGCSTHWSLNPWVILILGSCLLLGVARPSCHARLTRRWQKVVSRLSDGLGLDLQAAVIPLEQVEEQLLANGINGTKAEEVINAFAVTIEGTAFVLATPGAAGLPNGEISFIAAHEIGHHVLGHTRERLSDKVVEMLGTRLGQILTLGLSAVWKHLIAPQRSQAHEFAADEWAARHLQRRGLDIRKCTALLDRFERKESGGFLDRLGTKLFGSHPPALERKARLQKLINS
jgi:Zn-dependent protease with chaperone function